MNKTVLKIKSLKMKLIKIEKQKINIQNELKELYQQCPHSQFKLTFVESFSFENTPKLECTLCEFLLTPDEHITKMMYKQKLEEMYEREHSTEEIDLFYEKHPNGFNW